MLMCLSCGEFVVARSEGGKWMPKTDECPGCGGTEFRNNGTGTVIRTDHSSSEESGASSESG